MKNTNPSYPQFMISNASFDNNFINTVGEGNPVYEYARNMIAFIIYYHFTTTSINSNYIDQRYFVNLDNAFAVYNLSRFATTTTFEIVKRCAIADSTQTKGSYSDIVTL